MVTVAIPFLALFVNTSIPGFFWMNPKWWAALCFWCYVKTSTHLRKKEAWKGRSRNKVDDVENLKQQSRVQCLKEFLVGFFSNSVLVIKSSSLLVLLVCERGFSLWCLTRSWCVKVRTSPQLKPSLVVITSNFQAPSNVRLEDSRSAGEIDLKCLTQQWKWKTKGHFWGASKG